MIVYLAGPVRGPNASWRLDLSGLVADAYARLAPDHAWPAFLHPGGNLPEPYQDNPEEHVGLYVPADLLSVRRADLLVALLLAEESGRGTGIEVGMALGMGKPVLALAPTQADADSWRFAIAAGALWYRSAEKLAVALVMAAAQLSGISRYNPDQPG